MSDPHDVPPWAAEPGSVLAGLGVDPAQGLDESEVPRRLADHGRNRLRELRAPGPWRILAAQFASWIVALLAVAAGVAFAFGETLEGVAILVVLLLNAGIGFGTELRAVRSMEALRALGTVLARVRRGGVEREVPAEELVPGDVLLVEAGDVVTADARLLEASKLEADESALTGESLPVAKAPEPTAPDAPLAERASMLFKGTALARGSAAAVVTTTGMNTELGTVARLVEEAEDERTPLEKRLDRLGHKLMLVAVAIAVATTGVGIAAGQPALLMVETGIALAVAAIPEGLPIVATMALARGMFRMARRNALINRLSAVETLGATSVIFTDKTGTLTENRMRVRSLELEGASVPLEEVGASAHPAAAALVEAGVLCNGAALGASEADADVGDPTELALLHAGRAVGVERDALLARFPEVREEAFDSETMRMATVHRAAEDGAGPGLRVAVKGATEAVLDDCARVLAADGTERPLDDADRRAWTRRSEELAAGGLRVLALARGTVARPEDPPFRDLVLLGLAGLADPPRAEVPAAVAACHRAGIRVVMVTGDQPATAASIAAAVGLVPDVDPAAVVHGSRLGALAPGTKGGAQGDAGAEPEAGELLGASVYARVTPEQKLRLVDAWQRAGHVVAMTGDGVNDAPALREADIGVAMGRRGTQVAREASDMVLTDDAFASIVAAVEQGRVIFANLRKFVVYLLSCNVSEVAVVAGGAALGGPLPLLPLQILFLNLVTDVFPALALAFGEGDGRELERPPRDPREPVLTAAAWRQVALFGALLSVCVLGARVVAQTALGLDGERAAAVSFLTLAFAQLAHVFDVRERGTGALANDVVRNRFVWGALALCTSLILGAVWVPAVASVLRIEDPGAAGWAVVAVASLLPMVAGQLMLGLRADVAPRDPGRSA